MFRNGFPDASIKDKLTKHKTIINYSGLPKYCVIAVLERFIMKKAYLRTIEDFEIELANTEWWRFKRDIYLQKQISHYVYLLNAL